MSDKVGYIKQTFTTTVISSCESYILLKWYYPVQGREREERQRARAQRRAELEAKRKEREVVRASRVAKKPKETKETSSELDSSQATIAYSEQKSPITGKLSVR